MGQKIQKSNFGTEFHFSIFVFFYNDKFVKSFIYSVEYSM